MGFTRKFPCLLVLVTCAAALAVPALADDGDGASACLDLAPCAVVDSPTAAEKSDLSRPGSVIIFPKFVRDDGVLGVCGAGNVSVTGECLPRTEIELGATCPTRFTTGDQSVAANVAGVSHPELACLKHDPVRVKFRWVCPGAKDFNQNFTCKTSSGFDVLLTVDGSVVFSANGFRLPDNNQVSVPPAPCQRGYLIGWVIDELGRPKKYDGLIGQAVIRNSATAAAVYRAITIQAEATTTPGQPIDLVPDPIDPLSRGLFFSGNVGQYRLVTGQVTGDVTFDRPALGTGFGFGVSTSLILLTLDVRSNRLNFPTVVPLDFWNGFETKFSTSVKFVCWGEFQLSTDIDPHLTQALMGTRKGIVQSDEAFSAESGPVTLLGLVQTNEIPLVGLPLVGLVARSSIVNLYNNGIRFPPTIFFP
jgi:hypothetical protein